MARYLKAQCRLCRREGTKLFLKGIKCISEKCPFVKRPHPPGLRARRPSKPSYYALQLREKQKAKRIYGVLERQFKRFFRIANKSKGVTGTMLMQLLERRLDNVIYRAIFAFSRNQARQFVCHGLFFIANRRVDIPSYIVREGEVIEVKAKESIKKDLRDNFEINSKERSVVPWLEVEKESLRIKITRLPDKKDITIPVNEQLIVELYSK